jgi:hypothetical protein
LGQVQCLGRARHVLALGDCDENAKLFQRHAGTIASAPHRS